MSDVKLPLVGSTNKKVLVFAAGGSVILIILLVYRKRQSTAATASSSGTSTTSTSTTDPNVIDPNTGLPYSSELGNVPIVSGLGTGGGMWPSADNDNDSKSSQGITTNGEWFQESEKYLTTHTGINGTALAAALGKYLTGQEVTSDQQSLIDQAIASQGYPPQSGLNGYPPRMHVRIPDGHKKDNDTRTIDAPGNEKLVQIAKRYGTTYEELAKLNPSIARRYLGRDIPKGTKIKIPVKG